MIVRTRILSLLLVCLAASQSSRLLAQDRLVADRLARLNWLVEEIQTPPRPGKAQPPVVTGLSAQPGGSLIAVVGDDHIVSLYDKSQRKFIQQLARHRDWVRAARFSPSGKLLATCGNDRTIRLWSIPSQPTERVTSRLLDSSKQAVIDLAFSNDGKKIASVGFDNLVRVYDVASGRRIRTWKASCKDNHAVCFSSDDSMVAAAGRDGVVHVWNLRDGPP